MSSTKHTYYASSHGVKASVLIAEAIREAERATATKGGWKLDMIDEFHREVEDKGKVDIEAKVVVRHS